MEELSPRPRTSLVRRLTGALSWPWSWLFASSPARVHTTRQTTNEVDIYEILCEVRRIEIQSRRLVQNVIAGAYESVFKGRGMEFAEVREYTVEDDVRDIDWNVTARMGHPFIKRYAEERELTVMLLVDASFSHDFGTTTHTKAAVAARIAALLAFAAIQSNDRVGLIMFTSEVELYVPPKKGKRHVLRLVREMLYFQPRHAGTDLGRALRFLNQITTRRCVVFLISDFLSAGFEQPLSLANQRHDMVAITIVDPREFVLPCVGFIRLYDAETGEFTEIDTKCRHVRQHYNEQAREYYEQLESTFKRIGMDFVRVETGHHDGNSADGEAVYTRPLLQFFHKRAMRR